MIIRDLVNHKDDHVPHSLIITGPEPVPLELPGSPGNGEPGVLIQRQDLRTTHEEADTIIVQQAAHHRAGGQSLVIVADDTDVFLLLMHFRHCGAITAAGVFLESPRKGRASIDIDATIQENLSIIPGLLAAHVLTGCDTVASYYGIGKGTVLKVLKAGDMRFTALGDSSLPMDQYHKLFDEARAFLLACYKLSRSESLTDARVIAWQNKMCRNAHEPPKLCALPPTEAAFRQNTLRSHLALAVMLDCMKSDPPALDPMKHGWYQREGSDVLFPTVVPADTPLAPSDLLKLIKCGCSSERPCTTRRCSCRANRLSCTIFCTCRGGEDYNNDS